MPAPVVHFELSVGNDEKAVEFYRSLFGWELKFYEGHGWGISAGEKGIGGDIQTNTSTFPPHCSVYVEVENITESLTKAESLGGTAIFGPTDLGSGYGFIGMFKDPDGILMGLYQKP